MNGITLTGKDRSSDTTLSTKNLTWTVMGTTLHLLGKRFQFKTVADASL